MNNLNFSNVIGEYSREYYFIGKGGVLIQNVEKELVSESGGTRLITKDQGGHYIPYSWSWMAKHFLPDSKVEIEKQLLESYKTDISVEKSREYTFAINDEFCILVIEEPKSLYVYENGIHEILTVDKLITILPKWIKISWEPKPNEPTFVT